MRRKETYVSGVGTVESYRKDKTEGHDEIVLRLKDGRRVVISNNTKLGIRVEPKNGDGVNYHGYGVKGTNVVHKVHPNKRQRGGWLELVKAAEFGKGGLSSDMKKYLLAAVLIGAGFGVPWLYRRYGLRHNNKAMRYKDYYAGELDKEKTLSNSEIKKLLLKQKIKAKFIPEGKDVPFDKNQDFVPVVDGIVKGREGTPFFDPSFGPNGVVVTNGRATENTIRHELGHAIDLRNGTFGDPNRRRIVLVDTIRDILSPKSTAIYKREERAWDNAGYRVGDKARDEALKTYELGIRNNALASTYPKVKLLGDVAKAGGVFALLNALKKEAGYKPPYTIDQIRKEYGDEVADRLSKDQVHKWRADTGVELVHKEPDLKEFRRIVRNWKLMDDAMKARSDKKSIELFGTGNMERVDAILQEYKRKETARKFVAAVRRMALKRKLNMFLVTDGASGIVNNGNPAVRNAREAQIKWELEHGEDPDEDWGEKKAQAVDPNKWPDYKEWQKQHKDKDVDQVRDIVRNYYRHIGDWGVRDTSGHLRDSKYIIRHGDDAVAKAIIRSSGELERAKRVNCHEMAAVILDRLQKNRVQARRVLVDKDDHNGVRMGHSTVLFQDKDGRWHRATGGMKNGKKSRLGNFDSLEDAIDQYIAVEKANKQTTDDERVDVYDTTDIPFTDSMPWPEYLKAARKGNRIYHQGGDN